MPREDTPVDGVAYELTAANRSSDRCPVCNGRLYRLDTVLYCPDEDAHTGGLIVYDDGSYRRLERVHTIKTPT